VAPASYIGGADIRDDLGIEPECIGTETFPDIGIEVDSDQRMDKTLFFHSESI
jgi:hypothetical protein